MHTVTKGPDRTENQRPSLAGRLLSWSARFWRTGWALSGVLLFLGASGARSQTVELNIVGGLSGVNQFTMLEEPFWRDEIGVISGGRIKATIQPFDRAGLPGAELLRLIQNGVVPFGTSLLALAADDDPVLNVADLPGLNPDFSALRRSVEAFRPALKARLKARYDVELLGIYTYPAQVIFCVKPFASLADLRGRRVRHASVDQHSIILALDAIPVKTSFGDIVNTVKRGAVDCAITGTLSGNEIGLSDITTHIHAMAVNWGVSAFSANGAVWRSLKPDIQEMLRAAVGTLERRIWEAADRETSNGWACNIGSPTCTGAKRGKMTLVTMTPQDMAMRKRLFAEVSLTRWLERCGSECAEVWNRTVGPQISLFIDKNQSIVPNEPSPSRD